ncbi:MAG: hypothetical protein J6S67_16485 [Methanobrevibacter sp.]|nr:hypothetical protein [Methanobrevibacter sp.]
MANQYRSVLSAGASTGGNALPAEVLSGKTFTNDNGLQTGTMTNNGAVTESLTVGQSYTIPQGYHNGSGVVTATSTSPMIDDIPATYSKITSILTGGSTVSITDATVNGIMIVKYTQRGTVATPTASGADLIHSVTQQGNDTNFLSNVICFYKATSINVSFTMPAVTMSGDGNTNCVLY